MSDKFISQCHLINQELIKDKHVTIIGMGALGQMVLENLARLGFKRFTIIDHDKFEESNFNRQLFAKDKYLNESKVKVSAKEISEVFNDLDIEVIDAYLSKDNGLIKSSDILVDCVDDVKIKILIEEIANDLNIPMVHGAIDDYFGQVSYIKPGERIVKKIYKNYNRSNKNSLIISVNIVASYMAKEVLMNWINHQNNLDGELLLIDIYHNRIDKLKIE